MSDDSDSEKVPTSRVATFFSKNGAWYASAFFMLALLFGLVLVLVLPSEHENNSTSSTPLPATTGQAPPPLSAPAASAAESTDTASGWEDLGCNGTRGDHSVPALAPSVDWVPLGPYTVPTSKTLGPTSVEGPLRHCYQHTPSGAILAASNGVTTELRTPLADYERVVKALMTAGPARDKEISGRLRMGDKPVSLALRIRGFQVESCDPTRCNLDVVSELNGLLFQGSSSMVWSEGDWKFDGTDVREDGRRVSSVPPGFTSFSAGDR